MRVLVGYTAQVPQIVMHRPLPGRENKRDEIVAFGNGYTHLRPQPGASWNELLGECPNGWTPDVYIHWSPEYNALPWGWETADCLTAGVFGDWNLGGVVMQQTAPGFDVTFADRGGGERLKRFGHRRVEYVPLWAYYPELHRTLPDSERDIDILMVGNFNHAVQWERSRWLARIARLSQRWRVLVVTGVFGEEYVKLMNRAKIVFNRSIRGEINMRAYEAAACGAMLFYERENGEISSLYKDREECVLYGDEDLENLFSYYLAPENTAEREQIAAAGNRRVQTESYAHHFARMLDILEPYVAEHRENPEAFRRPFAALPELERGLRTASQWYHSSDRACFHRLNHIITTYQENFVSESDQAQISAFRGAMLGEWARRVPRDHEFCKEVIAVGISENQRAVRLNPYQVTARRNLGLLACFAGEIPYAEEILTTVLNQLADPQLTAEQLTGTLFPRDFDAFMVAVERVWDDYLVGSSEWVEGIRTVATAQIHFLLAGSAFDRAEYGICANHAREALKRMPHHNDSRQFLADSCRALGRIDEALSAYRQVCEEAPFDMEAWQDLASYQLELYRPDDALALLNSVRTLLDGCPVYAEFRPILETLVSQAYQAQSQIPPQQDNITRILAFPDWNDPHNWQGLIRDFVQEYEPSLPVLLMLRVDPSRYPDATQLLERLQGFLVNDLALATMPNITLLNQPLGPPNEWQLYSTADAVIFADAHCGFRASLADNLGCTVQDRIGMQWEKAA